MFILKFKDVMGYYVYPFRHNTCEVSSPSPYCASIRRLYSDFQNGRRNREKSGPVDSLTGDSWGNPQVLLLRYHKHEVGFISRQRTKKLYQPKDKLKHKFLSWFKETSIIYK